MIYRAQRLIGEQQEPAVQIAECGGSVANAQAFETALPMLTSLVTRNQVHQVDGTLPADHPTLPRAAFVIKPYLMNRTDPANQGLGAWNVSAYFDGETQPSVNVNVMGLPSTDGPTAITKDRRFSSPAAPLEEALAMDILYRVGDAFNEQQQAEAPASGSRSRKFLGYLAASLRRRPSVH